MRVYAFSAFCAVLLAACVANAQNQTAFSQFIQSPSTKQAVSEIMLNQASHMPNWCGSMKFVPQDIIVVSQPLFDELGIIQRGVWKDIWTSQGCASDRTFNVLTIVQNGNVNRVPLLPGSSHADLQLQRDAMSYAIAATGTHGSQCSNSTVIDTIYVGPENAALPAPNANQAWREDWSVTGCGTTSIVAVHFAPDAVGGIAIHANPSETRMR